MQYVSDVVKKSGRYLLVPLAAAAISFAGICGDGKPSELRVEDVQVRPAYTQVGGTNQASYVIIRTSGNKGKVRDLVYQTDSDSAAQAKVRLTPGTLIINPEKTKSKADNTDITKLTVTRPSGSVVLPYMDRLHVKNAEINIPASFVDLTAGKPYVLFRTNTGGNQNSAQEVLVLVRYPTKTQATQVAENVARIAQTYKGLDMTLDPTCLDIPSDPFRSGAKNKADFVTVRETHEGPVVMVNNPDCAKILLTANINTPPGGMKMPVYKIDPVTGAITDSNGKEYDPWTLMDSLFPEVRDPFQPNPKK